MGTLKRAFANNIRTDGKPLSLEPTTVTAHSPETDLQPLKSDLTALALREATNESSVAFNLPNQFIDTFTDDTNLGTQTTVDRNDGYIASVYSATTNITAGIHGGDNQTPAQTASGSSSYTGYDGVTRSNGQIGDNGSYNSYSLGHLFDATDDFELIISMRGTYQATGYLYGNDMDALANIGTHTNNGFPGSNSSDAFSTLSQGTYQGQYHSPVSGDGNSDYRNLYRWHRSGSSFKLQYYGRSTSDITVDATSIAAIRASTNYIDNIGGVQTRNEKMLLLVGEAGSINYIKIEAFNKTASTSNATGTLIQSANTVTGSRTEVGGTMLYKDNAGTATLGSANDLAIYFTCNGGTNWTEAASYNAITPVY